MERSTEVKKEMQEEGRGEKKRKQGRRYRDDIQWRDGVAMTFSK